MSSIPQNLVQCTFDFDALSDQPADEAVLHTDDVVPQKQKFCPGCKQWLPTDHFGKQSNTKDGLRRVCKSCRHEEYNAGREHMLKQHREAYHSLSPDERREFLDRQNEYRNARSARERQAGMCAKCLARPAEIGRCCKRCYTYQHFQIDKIRDEVFAAYGNICAVCGESHPAFLAIDHINGGGAAQRRVTGGGHRLYLWLRKNNFPSGYQVLCHNHNWLKYVNHQSDETETYIKAWRANVRKEVLSHYAMYVHVAVKIDRRYLL